MHSFLVENNKYYVFSQNSKYAKLSTTMCEEYEQVCHMHLEVTNEF